jgi:hypothetical protein
MMRSSRSSGVQEFRSSGVQEFRSSGVQEFRSSGVQEFRSSGVKEFRSSGVQEFRSSGVQEFRSSGVQEFRSSGVQGGGGTLDCKPKMAGAKIRLLRNEIAWNASSINPFDALNGCSGRPVRCAQGLPVSSSPRCSGQASHPLSFALFAPFHGYSDLTF